jgi:hypothetical protein
MVWGIAVWLGLATVFCAAAGAYRAAWAGPEVEAWIAVEKAGGATILVPSCRASADIALEYQLLVYSGGPAGASRTRQSGEVLAKAGEDTKLCRLAVSLPEGGGCRAELKIIHAGEELATKALSLGTPGAAGSI